MQSLSTKCITMMISPLKYASKIHQCTYLKYIELEYIVNKILSFCNTRISPYEQTYEQIAALFRIIARETGEWKMTAIVSNDRRRSLRK